MSKIKCNICNNEYNGIKELTKHIMYHNITPQEYYDTYILKNSSNKICKNSWCKNHVKFYDLKKGYSKYCSSSCASKSIESKEKYKQTMLERYGVENGFQSEEIKNKSKQTMLERYGVEYNSRTQQYKDSYKATMIERYGVEYPLRSLIIKEKMKNTMIERYGVSHYSETDEYKDKYKQICLEKYGVDNAFQSEEIKDKIKNIIIEKYGVDNPSKNKEIQYKKINTNRERYNVNYPLESEEIRNKAKITFIEKYGVDNPSKNKDIKLIKLEHKRKSFFDKLLKSDRLKYKCIPLFDINDYNGVNVKYKWKCIKCNTIFEDHLDNGKIPRCINCYPINTYSSKGELEVFEFIKQYYNNAINRNRGILSNFKELDIYIPDINLAIEYNGLYYHSELSGNKDYNYHLNKLIECEKYNITLMHIFEDEWINKQDIVKSILLSKLGKIENKIYARNCEIKIIDNNNIVDEFLFTNHLQGNIYSDINIGLYYNNNLVSLLCIGKPRFTKKYEYEITRFCSIKNYNIIGSASKLLSFFIKQYNPNNIISYIDRRYSNNITNNYLINSNFKYIGYARPSYYYTKDYTNRENRIKYQKNKLLNLLEIYDPLMTEWENMQLNGYDRIWDCGNNIFGYIS